MKRKYRERIKEETRLIDVYPEGWMLNWHVCVFVEFHHTASV